LEKPKPEINYNGAKKEPIWPEMSPKMAEHKRHFSRQKYNFRLFAKDFWLGFKGGWKNGLPEIRFFRRWMILNYSFFGVILGAIFFSYLKYEEGYSVEPVLGLLFGFLFSLWFFVRLSRKTYPKRKFNGLN
jgi:hypothetical protein